MTERELRALFADYGVDSEQQPEGEQAQLLIALLEMYAGLGLLPDGRPRPLCEVCPRADPCWADEPPEARRAGADKYGEDGGICLPWIGRAYRPGGVCALAMNFNVAREDYTDLLLAYGIVFEQYVPGLEAGSLAAGGSRFMSGLARVTGGLLDVLDGLPVIDRDARALGGTYQRIAYLQAIKCMPRRERSAPGPAMWHECPPLLLRRELEILRPAIVVALGADAQQAVEQLEGYDPQAGPAPSMGMVRFGDVAFTAYGVDHPAWSGARASEEQFLEQLRQAQAAPSRDRRPGE